jgi:ketol-acid reductoisomerase
MATNDNLFTSSVFGTQLKTIELPGSKEIVMAGERKFELLKQAFAGISEILVIGYKSQGPAHANNLRSSVKEAGLNTVVRVALRTGSESRKDAERDGFTEANGTLVAPEAGIPKAGLVIMLIADGALATEGERLIGLMKPGAILGLAHGFYMGYLEQLGKTVRPDIGVIGVCPKGMGPSVRRLYEQGSGINCSFAVEQGDPETMTNVVLGWALGIGAPYTFRTTLGNEMRSDLVGERAILLGGVHGIVEALYGWKVEHGAKPEQAYTETVESLVGPISQAISESGLLGVYDKLDAVGRQQFSTSYNASYPHLYALTHKIYQDVSSGREVAEVVQDNQDDVPLTVVDGSTMWRVGETVRSDGALTAVIDPNRSRHIRSWHGCSG